MKGLLTHKDKRDSLVPKEPFSQTFQIDPWIIPVKLERLDSSTENSIPLLLFDALNINSKMMLTGISGSGKTLAMRVAANELTNFQIVKAF